MNNVDIQSIKKELIVEASQKTAFKVFTEKMDSWWPGSHHVGSSPLKETVLEQRENGRWYTKHEDGSEVNVGYVLEWDPYAQLILAWQINADYKYDPRVITEVEVQFIPESEKQTRIKFEHKNLERLGGGSKPIGDMDEGWGWILQLYKTFIES
jgi:hypothetical protein